METFYKSGVIFLWFISVAWGNCPAPESIAPCACSTIKNGISVNCRGPEDADRIVSAIENLGNVGNLELVLESLTLPMLPSSMKELSSLHLYNVYVQRILNSSSSAWSKLSELIIESSIISDSPWQLFKETPLLKHLEISRVELPTIGYEFTESIPSELTYLDIRKTKTTTLESRALSHLKKLQYFIMVDVPLQEFPRNVLPMEMPDLYTFILGNTKIEKLEANFFQGMPKLEIIMLNGNKLTTLDYGLFVPVENQLTHLLAERNPLVCDCDLLWLTSNKQNKGSMKVLATCTDDRNKERKEVNALIVSEYCT